ncbi:MAG: hypothetical protein ACOYMN_10980 [Roseimicrobium sp.]
MSKRSWEWCHWRRGVLLALALLVCASHVLAHPFDGDGSGPAKEGASNAQAYLYVEPFTCRVECLIWLPTALTVFGLPQGDAMLLPSETKATLLERAKVMVRDWCVLKLDGVEQRADFATAQLVKGVPGRSEAPAPDESVAVMNAMLGLTLDFAAPSSFETAEVEWRKFATEMQAIPLTVSYGPMSEAGLVMTLASPVAAWKNGGRLPPPKPLVVVPPVPPMETMDIPVASAVWVLVAAFWLLKKPRHGRRRSGQAVMIFSVLALGAILLWLMAHVPVTKPWAVRRMVPADEAQRVLLALLRNTYRAFDQRSESDIYDVLSRSIHGDFLQTIYLQTVQALSLEGKDGTRVRVTDVDVQVDGMRLLRDRDGFVAEGQWTALGSVGHWGHMHQRINRYTARLTVEPVNGAWKLTGLEVLEERRM